MNCIPPTITLTNYKYFELYRKQVEYDKCNKMNI